MPSRTTDGDQAPEILPPPLTEEANAAGNSRGTRQARRGVVGARGRSVDASGSGTMIGNSGQRLANPLCHAEGKRRLEGEGRGGQEKGENESGGAERVGVGMRVGARLTRWQLGSCGGNKSSLWRESLSLRATSRRCGAEFDVCSVRYGIRSYVSHCRSGLVG